MKKTKTLTQLDIGKTGKVLKICADRSDTRRFYDMGLIPGTLVECVLKRHGGDIAAYKIRGAVMALRCDDSDKIFVF